MITPTLIKMNYKFIDISAGNFSGAIAENGKLYVEGEYENGKEVGEWIFYNEDGTEKERKKY